MNKRFDHKKDNEGTKYYIVDKTNSQEGLKGTAVEKCKNIKLSYSINDNRNINDTKSKVIDINYLNDLNNDSIVSPFDITHSEIESDDCLKTCKINCKQTDTVPIENNSIKSCCVGSSSTRPIDLDDNVTSSHLGCFQYIYKVLGLKKEEHNNNTKNSIQSHSSVHKIQRNLDAMDETKDIIEEKYERELRERELRERELRESELRERELRERELRERELRERKLRERELRERELRERELRERELRERKLRERELRESEHREREHQDQKFQRQESYEHTLFQLAEQIHTTSDNDYLALFTEKRVNQGEDSVPLIYRSNECVCVGVFDGMGGSGSAGYSTYTRGRKTGAYLSSRIVRALCLNTLLEKDTLHDSIQLKHYILDVFKQLIKLWNIQPSGLRSAFVRVLPTTLAVVEARKKGQSVEITSYWAGDSRNYILLKSGLKQISNDDLRQAKDPLENLRSDDALSNCVCQDKPFTINEYFCGKFNEPLIIISATDGCFGYLQTPMHFEYIILEALMKSDNCRDWCDYIKSTLEPISSDDFTIGLQLIDGDFIYWKQALYARYKILKDTIIGPIDNLTLAYEHALKEYNSSKEKLYDSITDFWNSYKSEFLFNRLQQ